MTFSNSQKCEVVARKRNDRLICGYIVVELGVLVADWID